MFSNPDCVSLVNYFDIVETFKESGESFESTFSGQIPGAYALLYKLNDGRIVILGEEAQFNGSHGLMFENATCFENEFANSRMMLPRDELDFFEKNQQILAEDFQSFKYYDRNGLEVSFVFDEEKRGSIEYLKSRFHRLNDESQYRANLALGEYLRSELGGEWISVKRNGMIYPYAYPMLLSSDGLVIDVVNKVERYWNDPKISLDFTINLMRHFPGFRPPTGNDELLYVIGLVPIIE